MFWSQLLAAVKSCRRLYCLDLFGVIFSKTFSLDQFHKSTSLGRDNVGDVVSDKNKTNEGGKRQEGYSYESDKDEEKAVVEDVATSTSSSWHEIDDVFVGERYFVIYFQITSFTPSVFVSF